MSRNKTEFMAHARHQLLKLLLLPFIPLMKTIRLILSSIVALSLILLLFISKTLLFFSKPFLPVIVVLWRLLMWLMFPLFFICLFIYTMVRPLKNHETLFRHWLDVIYRDRPETVGIIIENIHQDLIEEDEDGENNTQEENNETAVFKNLLTEGFILHNNLEDYAHLFSVDWKDGEGFIDCIAEMAERFNVVLNWTEQQLEEDLPDELARAVYPLFEAAGAVLYSADTGSDYYTFIIIPQQDTADFEKISKQYGVSLKRANKTI